MKRLLLIKPFNVPSKALFNHTFTFILFCISIEKFHCNSSQILKIPRSGENDLWENVQNALPSWSKKNKKM